MKILIIIATLAITLATSGDSLAEARTWTSSSGSKIEAEFISITNGEPGTIEKVTLKTADGRTLTIRTSQLSEADQKWLTDKKPKAASAPAPTSPSSPSTPPAPSSSTPAAGGPSDAELDRLSEILDKALKENPPEAERDEAATIFARLMPTADATGKALRWDVSIPPSADPGNDTSVLISVDLFPADAEDDDRDARLVWMHVVYHAKKPESFGFDNDKIGRYPVMRAEDRHVFVLIGRTEVRAIADAESYESDATLDALVESMNLDAIKGL